MSISTKVNALQHVATGYFRKFMIDWGIISPHKLLKKRDKQQVVVSLTSYGRRIEKDIVYYTLISLLRQTYPPDRIILWLDDINWNINNIPKKLKKLQVYGIEIAFCKDIRSYTKLVPALTLCNENSILITVDDDVIYKSNIIESLIKAHKQYPKDIITRQARFPQVINNSFTPYNKWPLNPNKNSLNEYIMPIGVSGVLYPPNSLHPMTIQRELFEKLCPLADDLWFWIMAKMNGTCHRVIAPNKSIGDSFDDLYQFFHKGSALTHSNSKQNTNDLQLSKLIDFFGLSVSDLINNC